MTTDAQVGQLGLGVWGSSVSDALVTQMALGVWARIPKVTTYYTWPFRILPPRKQRPYRIGSSKLGPVAADGVQQQVTRIDGGGLWRLDCSFEVWTIDQAKALRAWATFLDNGAAPFIMPLIDLHFAPRDLVGGVLRKPTPTTPASDYFSEVAAYAPSPIVVAEIVQAASIRATQVRIQIDQGSAPKGGEFFSILHPGGWRLYSIGRIVNELSGGVYDVQIRPPLREAVVLGSGSFAVEFDIPRCLMRLHPESSPQLALAVTNFRVGEEVTASFVEHFEA